MLIKKVQFVKTWKHKYRATHIARKGLPVGHVAILRGSVTLNYRANIPGLEPEMSGAEVDSAELSDTQPLAQQSPVSPPVLMTAKLCKF